MGEILGGVDVNKGRYFLFARFTIDGVDIRRGGQQEYYTVAGDK